MVVRKNFEKDLQVLKDKLSHMGALAEEAFKDAIESLKSQDLDLAEKVLDGDDAINQLEEEIEELVVRIIASQQPVATDLRKVMSALKITTSVERIGDFAVDIAKTTKRIGKEQFVKPLKDIPAMADIVQTMIREGLNAYIDENVVLAEEIANMDDQVDSMYATVVQDLLKKVIDTPDKMDQIIQLAFVARYIERSADHVTNIAEGILYSVKGKRVDLNQ
jgi:phosphate transport system protein